MQYIRTEAIILRRTNYGEADRILNMLTPNMGKVAAIAKGVRKPKSKLAGGLELFSVCDITLGQGRGELAIVTSARIKEFFGDILHDYDRMQCAYEVIKQINKATETVSEPEFYELLTRTLSYLNQPTIKWQLSELWFRLHLRNLLGDGLNITTDASGQPLQESEQYGFDAANNSFVLKSNGQFSGEHIKFLRLAMKTSPAVLSRVATQVDPERDFTII